MPKRGGAIDMKIVLYTFLAVLAIVLIVMIVKEKEKFSSSANCDDYKKLSAMNQVIYKKNKISKLEKYVLDKNYNDLLAIMRNPDCNSLELQKFYEKETSAQDNFKHTILKKKTKKKICKKYSLYLIDLLRTTQHLKNNLEDGDGNIRPNILLRLLHNNGILKSLSKGCLKF